MTASLTEMVPTLELPATLSATGVLPQGGAGQLRHLVGVRRCLREIQLVGEWVCLTIDI